MKILKSSLYVVMISFFSFSCSNNDTGRMVVRLTDSPGDYEEVNIDLLGVQVHRAGGNQESGWIDLDVIDGVYNLLDLTDGVETIIADSRIPAGSISQLRLVLGDNNTIQIDGVRYPLNVPSGSQSGLKLQINESILEGITYTFLLDFDAARSVVKAGQSGVYNLKPVIRIITEARDGAVEGTVLPASENVAIYALSGEDTVGTSYAITDNAGYFLGGLEEGSYDLVFDPGENSIYAADTIENVSVLLGEITNAGELTLQQK